MPSMNVSLTTELMQIVQRKVESGLYNNASEVIREAIRQLDANAQFVYELKMSRLREALVPGLKNIAEGRISEYSVEELIAELGNKTDHPE